MLTRSCCASIRQDRSLEAPGAALPNVQDQYGALAPRASYLTLERTILARCLLYAVQLSAAAAAAAGGGENGAARQGEALAPATIAAIAELLRGLALAVQAAGACSRGRWSCEGGHTTGSGA